jgi:hypothetical protein
MRRVLLVVALAAAAMAVAVPARAAPGDHRNGPIKLTLTAWNPVTTEVSLNWRAFNNGVHFMLLIGRVGDAGAYGGLGVGDYATSWSGSLSGTFGTLSPGKTYYVQAMGCRDDPELADAWQCWFGNRIELTIDG